VTKLEKGMLSKILEGKFEGTILHWDDMN
jgi:hypothetical protein